MNRLLHLPKLLPKPIVLIAMFCLLATASIMFNTNKVEAATINVASGTDSVSVDSSCSLSEAIGNINDQAVTNADCIAGDGVDDTIVLPTGTITLSGDLPAFTEPAIVEGVSKTSSVVDGNGNLGFNGDFSSTDTGLFDYTFSDFTVTGAADYGIAIRQAKKLTASDIVIDDSATGGLLTAITVDLVNVDIKNNTGGIDIASIYNTFSGLLVIGQGLTSSDTPTISVKNVKAYDNSGGEFSGLEVHLYETTGSGNVSTMSMEIQNSYVHDNTATIVAGLAIGLSVDGPNSTTPADFSISSTTISNNIAEVPSSDPGNINVVSGINISGYLKPGLHATNITSYGNQAINNYDNRITVAGFVGGLSSSGAKFHIVNSTIINNDTTFSTSSHLIDSITTSPAGAAFAFPRTFLDGGFSLVDIDSGAQSQNSIIAGNSTNGENVSCMAGDKAAFGLSGIIDLTPVDLGHNITDDPNCTGYQVKSNILSTLGPLQDNGGPVPTIALLSGSPAIGAAGQVLGISTDARGIPRPTNPDVGAYQTVLGSSTTTTVPSPTEYEGIGVPNTGIEYVGNRDSGIKTVIMSILSITLILSVLYVVRRDMVKYYEN